MPASPGSSLVNASLSPTRYGSKTQKYPTGHSERRTLFHETSAFVGQKVRAALDAGLKVVPCVGETLEERETAKTCQVIEDQLTPLITALKKPEDWKCVDPLTL
jgi:triosephosphate isomerase